MSKTVENPRQLAIDRAVAAGNEVHNSFKDAGVAGVRTLDLATINKGDVVTLPTELKIIMQPITGSTTKVAKIVTEEGLDFYPSVLTRGATALDGSGRVKPTGTVVEKCQTYSNMDDFYNNELAGKKIKFTNFTEVVARGYNGEDSRTVKVWQIDFAK